MEQGFMSVLKPDEHAGFVRYSSSLRDLAKFFRIVREKDPVTISSQGATMATRDTNNSAASKKMKRTIKGIVQAKMIFGVGECPNAIPS